MNFDKVSKKKATDCTPDSALISLSVTKTTDPITKKQVFLAPDGYDTSSSDNIHDCNDVKPFVNSISYANGKLTANVTQGTHPLSSVEFRVDGTLVGTAQLSSSGTVSLAYNGTGTKAVSVTVIDTALYSGTLQNNINFPAGSGGGSGGGDDNNNNRGRGNGRN